MQGKKKIILAIDDNPDVCDLVERALQESDFEIFKANGGQEGIRMAQENIPDLILLDIMMPELDGFTVSSFLKKIPETESIPIIFLTGRSTDHGRMVASKAGAVDYITKPFSPKELLKKIKIVLNIK